MIDLDRREFWRKAYGIASEMGDGELMELRFKSRADAGSALPNKLLTTVVQLKNNSGQVRASVFGPRKLEFEADLAQYPSFFVVGPEVVKIRSRA